MISLPIFGYIYLKQLILFFNYYKWDYFLDLFSNTSLLVYRIVYRYTLIFLSYNFVAFIY